MRFGILICGHWVADPLGVLARGGDGPCPEGDGMRPVISIPDDPGVSFLLPPGDPGEPAAG